MDLDIPVSEWPPLPPQKPATPQNTPPAPPLPPEPYPEVYAPPPAPPPAPVTSAPLEPFRIGGHLGNQLTGSEWQFWYQQAAALLQKQLQQSPSFYSGGGGPKYGQFISDSAPVLRVSCQDQSTSGKKAAGAAGGGWRCERDREFDEKEFNPNRFRRKTTKNQHIYGVWAADEDDSDGEGGGGGRGRKPKGRPDYSSGVSFISAGVQQPNKSEKPAEGEEQGEKQDDIPVTDSSSEDESTAIPKAFMKRAAQPTHFRDSDIAGLRTRPSAAGTSAGGHKAMGMFGIGAQLAMKMGWQPGKGLGKDEQGITAPIEAVVRKGRGAIGAYGRENKSKPAEIVIEDTAQKKAAAQERKWKKIEAGEKKEAVEVRYMTVEQVLEQKNLIVRPDAGKLAKTKVIDLTGPETRILSGYHAISGQRRPQEEWEAESRRDKSAMAQSQQQKDAFDLPELTHNIGLLLETCEQDILRADKKSRYASDRSVTIEQEQKRLRRVIDQEEEMIGNLEELGAQLKGLTEPSETLDIQAVYEGFVEIQRRHPEEWELNEIYSLVPAAAVSTILRQLKSWAPFDSPMDPLSLFLQFKELLGSHHKEFNILVWEAWMPTVRPHLASWDVKSPSTMLHFIQSWQPLLPAWIYNNILDQIVLPKLNEGVEAWNPLADSVPVHSWIQPWAPVLDTKLEIVYPTIRRKFGKALVHWHPCDSSAKQIIAPWQQIFSKGAMDAFLLKNVVPKLEGVMEKELQLTLPPMTQNLDIWNGVMDWLDLIPAKQICTILQNHFFPKWLQLLVSWLNQRPNLEEVYRWYTWWRSTFPEPLMKEAVVTEGLQKALQVINTSIQNPGAPLPQAGAFIPQPQHPPLIQQPPPLHMLPPEFMADALRMTSTVPFGFRDLVQMKCEEMGLIFVPIPNRSYEGKQVYRCGNALIYISANVIFVMDGASGLWIPTSLEQLLLHFAR